MSNSRLLKQGKSGQNMFAL